MTRYSLITSLLRVLPNGKQAKAVVDTAIDQAAHLQNLRECTSAYLARGGEVGVNYLIRYFYLIVFAAYLVEEEGQSAGTGGVQFSLWISGRKEITNLVSRHDRIDLAFVEPVKSN